MTLSNFKQETTYKHTLGLSKYEIEAHDLPLLAYINEFDYFVINYAKVSFDEFVYSSDDMTGNDMTGNVWSYTLHSDGKLDILTLYYPVYVAIKVFCAVDPITNPAIREIKEVNGHYFGYAVAFDKDDMFEVYDTLRKVHCA